MWLGSGALAAFDGLSLVLNQILNGTDVSEPGWTLHDTVLVIKALVGVLAAAVGALAVTAAANDNQKPGGGRSEQDSSGQEQQQEAVLPGALPVA